MERLNTIKEIQSVLNIQRNKGVSIGFVPTMGALHLGHIDLIKKSLRNGDFTVCSIYVNPTQFNDPNDLEKYPRTLEADIEYLRQAGCHLLFVPDTSEIYPKDLPKVPVFDLEGADVVMEGASRPGHFNGVIQVVHRLLDIIQPDMLYMGLKDYQQQAIVGLMIVKLSIPVTLVPCPTIREDDGLAMSSRNRRLTIEWRKKSPMIYQSLIAAGRDFEAGKPVMKILNYYQNKLIEAGFKLDYLCLSDAKTLKPLEDYQCPAVLCVAAWAGEIRLIDNILLV